MTTPGGGGEQNRGQFGGIPMGGFSGGGVSGAVSVIASKLTGMFSGMAREATKIESVAKRTREHYEAAARAMGKTGGHGRPGPRPQGLGLAGFSSGPEEDEARTPRVRVRRHQASVMADPKFGTPPPEVVPTAEQVEALRGGRHAAPARFGMPRPSFGMGGTHAAPGGGGGRAAAFGTATGGLLAAGAMQGLAGASGNMVTRDIVSWNIALNGGRRGSMPDQQQALQRAMGRNQFGYFSAEDAAAQASALSTGFGVSAGADFNNLLRSAGGAAMVTPGFTGAQGASALQGLNSARSTNFMMGLGIRSRSNNGTLDPSQSVNQLYNKFGLQGLSREQIAFRLREGGSLQANIRGVAQGNTETEAFLRSAFLQRAGQGGRPLDLTDQAAMERLAPRTSRRASEAARAQERNALTVQEGMVKGFEAATKALEQFRDALNGVINTPGFNQLANIAAGGGVGGQTLLGGIPGATTLGGLGGLGLTYAAARLGAGRGVPGIALGAGGVMGAVRGVGRAIGRGGPVGIAGALAGGAVNDSRGGAREHAGTALGWGAAGAGIGAAIGTPFFGIGAVPGAAIGGAIGGVAGLGKSLLFANGGVVPGNHNNDTVPIQATPGEVVVPRGTVMKHGGAGELMRKLGFSGGGRGGANYAYGGEVKGDIEGMHPEFFKRLKAWSAAVGQPYVVGSGYRSMEEQQRLYDRWLRRVPGQAKAAKPGSSNHNYGLASDGPHWGGKNPGAFGLVYPMSYEPWHVEPVGAKGMRGGGGGGWKGALAGAVKKVGKMVTKAFGAIKAAVGGGKGDDATPGKAMALTIGSGQTLSLGSGQGLTLGLALNLPTSGGGRGGTGSVAGAAAGEAAGGSAGSSDPNANVALGRRLAAGYKWSSGAEWDALYKLWQKESGWNHLADNPSSSAYGIPQALIALHKMPRGYYDRKTGTGARTKGIGGSPEAQIRWGLEYIQGRYGSPSKAWAYHRAHNSYSKGSMYTEEGGTTHAGEMVVPARHAERLRTLMRRKMTGRRNYAEGGEVGGGMGDMETSVTPDDTALGGSSATSGGGSGGGGRVVQVNVTIAGANLDEARKLAMMLKQIMESDSSDQMIGAS